MALRIIPLEDVFVAALNVAQVYSILLVYRMFLPNGSGKVDQNRKKRKKRSFSLWFKIFWFSCYAV